jgi:hypothetical protein
MQDNNTNDLGFDLLMNHNRRRQSDDAMSQSSKSSFSIKKPSEYVDVKQHISSDNRSVLSYEITTEEDEESVIDVQSRSRPSNNNNVNRKSQQRQQAQSLASSSEYEEESVIASIKHNHASSNEEDILAQKKEILYQFDRLEKKGIRLPRKFSMASSYEEMKNEYERLKRDREVDASVKFQRRMVLAFASGVEYLNDKFDPFDVKLSGWSQKIDDDIEEYDEIFEDLHAKYKSKAKVAPELKLLFMMGSSAFMFHLTNSMFKTSLPGLDQVLKQNPELMKQFAAATANTMAQDQKKTNSPFGGLASMFGSMFGGGGGGGGNTNNNSQNNDINRPSSPPPRMEQVRMKGPSNIDDILNEINVDNNDRIEMMSTVTESELFDLADDASINGILASAKKTKKGKNSVELDL